MYIDQLESRKIRIQWTEEEWDQMAEIVWKMEVNSTDGLASLANRAQRQLPKDRQRPGSLTIASLQPLVERIQKRRREVRAKAEKTEELVARLTFFQDAPATKEAICDAITDEEIVTRFLPRVLRVMAPMDLVGTFQPEVLFDSVSTADLAAVVARRIVTDLQHPIEVTVNAAEARENPKPAVTPKSNGRKRRILVVGIRDGNQQRIVNESVGHLCDLRFLAANQVKRDMLPQSVDAVLLWNKTIGHDSRDAVLQAYPARMVSQHFGGVDQMVEKIKHQCLAVR